jgi:hypothetical protein
MSTQINIGKARLFSFLVKNADGSVNTTAVATPGTGNPVTLRVTVNPSNPREFAAVALAQSAGVNANITALGHTAQALIVIPALPDQTAVVIDEAGVGPEIDPPSWA